MNKRSGPVHVATTRRTYGGKVYETHLLRRSYREGGKVKNETVGNVSHLPPEIIAGIAGTPAYEAAVNNMLLADVQAANEHRLILSALRESGWNMARTAKALGISRATLYEKTRKHGIMRELAGRATDSPL